MGMQGFNKHTAVLTGAGSGFGLECARLGARLGMNLVLVDVQQDALDRAADEIAATGAQVLARRVDVSKAAEMEALGAAVAVRIKHPLPARLCGGGAALPAENLAPQLHRNLPPAHVAPGHVLFGVVHVLGAL